MDYPVLLRATKRKREAGRLERRAREILARHAYENPGNCTVDVQDLAGRFSSVAETVK